MICSGEKLFEQHKKADVLRTIGKRISWKLMMAQFCYSWLYQNHSKRTVCDASFLSFFSSSYFTSSSSPEGTPKSKTCKENAILSFTGWCFACHGAAALSMSLYVKCMRCNVIKRMPPQTRWDVSFRHCSKLNTENSKIQIGKKLLR